MEIIKERMSIITARRPAAGPANDPFGREAACEALRFHRTIPGYAETQPRSLGSAAHKYGVRSIFIKDESTRFGLNAFKGLGGSYALFRVLCDRLGLDHKTAVFSDFEAEEIREKCKDIVFVTATDGNHGKGVSWAAKLFGCRAYVYMPAGSVEVRRKAIEDAGADSCVITDFNYDKTVELASGIADENGWILIQDTAWEGYEEIPEWIVDGYLTMAAEIDKQLGDVWPTHVFLQAGVGAMAGGMTGYVMDRDKDDPPVITIVEPDTVACIYKSVEADDGKSHSIDGDPVTIMAGLNCGTPCSVTWPVIRDSIAFCCKCTDEVAEDGMRALAHPEGNDEPFKAGECGGVTYGVLLEILKDQELRDLYMIDEDSVIVLICSEGDTDPDNYRRITSM